MYDIRQVRVQFHPFACEYPVFPILLAENSVVDCSSHSFLTLVDCGHPKPFRSRVALGRFKSLL